jgi:hypothetical protein
MDEHILTIEKARVFAAYPEIYKIFWKNWDIITEVEYEALEYLINNSSIIRLKNVTYLSQDKIELLKEYKGVLDLNNDLKLLF